MRPSLDQVASATRIFRSISRTPFPVASQWLLHIVLSTQVPRRRNLSASAVRLKQEGGEPVLQSTYITSGGKAAGDHKPLGDDRQPAAKKEKKSSQQAKKRAASLKKSLHRVAIVAQKGGPSRREAKGGATFRAVEGKNESDSTISAVCVANSFNMEEVLAILRRHSLSIDPHSTGFDTEDVVHARNHNDGDIFVFNSGTVVTWSLPSDVVDDLATIVLLPAAEGPFLADKEEEDLEFDVDPEAAEARVGLDGVVVLGMQLPDREITMNKIAISSGLARSTKLGMLENSLDRYLESTRHIPEQLSSSGNGSLSRKMILQKTGELLNLRSQLNHYNELTDSLPDMLWDSETRLETYYGAVGKALNVSMRIKTLNSRISYAQEVIQAAQEVVSIAERDSSEAHGTRLEWIIIILIAVEVGFELRRLYKEFTEEDKTVMELKRIAYLLAKEGR